MRKDHALIDKILDILDLRDRWLILMHERPDGDTSGCATALAALGARLGKKVTLGGPDDYPPKYRFLLGAVPYVTLDQMPADFSGDGCVVVCVDTSNAERSVKGLVEARGHCVVINIDHHADNPQYGDINWIKPSASATGEIVTELMASSEWGITPFEANSLYAAIVTDNGNFSFSSASAKSHECAVELIKAGASPGRVTEELETNLSENTIRLWGRAFSKIERFSRGVCAIYWLSLADFKETGAKMDDTENLVNFLLRIKGVRLAALCREIDGGVRVSLRARSPHSAHEIAVVFGGGGHDMAAGCTIHEPIAEALFLLRAEMDNHATISDSHAE